MASKTQYHANRSGRGRIAKCLAAFSVMAATGGTVMITSPAEASNPVIAQASIEVRTWVGHYDICPHGDASFLPVVNGIWRLQVVGTRSDGTPIQGSLSASGVSTWNPTNCIPVNKNGALTGNFNATLDYVGAGGDVYGHAETAGGWAGNLDLPQINIGS